MSKVLIDRSAVEQALDAFDVCKTEPTGYTPHRRLRNAAITALRAALEQEKSPQNASSALQASCEVPQVTDQTEHFLVLADEEVYCTKHPQVEQEPAIYPDEAFDMGLDAIPYYIHTQPPRQPQVEQEPVAVVTGFYGGFPTIRPLEPATVLPAGMALYANPQPPRQPLTDQQIHDCFQHRHRDKATERRMITRSIEFAHGITGEQA